VFIDCDKSDIKKYNLVPNDTNAKTATPTKTQPYLEPIRGSM